MADTGSYENVEENINNENIQNYNAEYNNNTAEYNNESEYNNNEYAQQSYYDAKEGTEGLLNVCANNTNEQKEENDVDINVNIDNNNNNNNNNNNTNNTDKNSNEEKEEQNNSNEEADKSNENFNKFFVGGIPPDCWEEDVIKYFSAFGEVKEVQVMKDASMCRNRGFCFVTMGTKNSYDAVFASQHKIKNKAVEVREMQPQNIKRKIFVGGINAAFNESDLKEYFVKFGSVEKVTIMRDPIERRCRGFGFVVFCDENSVNEVLKKKVHQLDDKHKIEVRAAESRFKNAKMTPAPMYGGGMMSSPYGYGVSPYQIASPYHMGGGVGSSLGAPPIYSSPAAPVYAAYNYPPQANTGLYTNAVNAYANTTTAYGPQRSAVPGASAAYRMAPY